MRNIRISIGVLCVIAFASSTVVGQDNSAREKDRAEIEELMWRYARALDTGDGAAYAATYTVDGQFGTGPNATKGREALKKLADGVREQQAAATRVAILRAAQRGLRYITWKPTHGSSSSTRTTPATTHTT